MKIKRQYGPENLRYGARGVTVRDDGNALLAFPKPLLAFPKALLAFSKPLLAFLQTLGAKSYKILKKQTSVYHKNERMKAQRKCRYAHTASGYCQNGTARRATVARRHCGPVTRPPESFSGRLPVSSAGPRRQLPWRGRMLQHAERSRSGLPLTGRHCKDNTQARQMQMSLLKKAKQ